MTIASNVAVFLRYGDGAVGLTGWGWVMFWFMYLAISRKD